MAKTTGQRRPRKQILLYSGTADTRAVTPFEQKPPASAGFLHLSELRRPIQ
jgi:hypothetical protein